VSEGGNDGMTKRGEEMLKRNYEERRGRVKEKEIT
jgi:hypothetical protein